MMLYRLQHKFLNEVLLMRMLLYSFLIIAMAFTGCGGQNQNTIIFDMSLSENMGSDISEILNVSTDKIDLLEQGKYQYQTPKLYESYSFDKFLAFDNDNKLCAIEYIHKFEATEISSTHNIVNLVNKIRADMQKQYGDAVTHMGGSTEVRELSDIPDDDLTGVYQEYYWYPEQTDNCTVKLTLDAVTSPDPIINVSCKAHPGKESLGYDFDFDFAKHFGMDKTEVCKKLGIDIKKLTLSNTGIADISTVDYNGTEFAQQLMFDKANNDALYGGQYRCIVKSEDYRGSSISQLVNDIRADMIRIYGNPSTYPETNTAFEKFVPAEDDELTGQYEEYWYVSGKVPCTISLKLDAMGNDMFTAITVSYKTGPDLYGVRKSTQSMWNN